MRGDPQHSAASTSNESEEFLLSFQKIDWMNGSGNTSTSDDWATPSG
jgi:type VI protein secretion system component Hcp